MSQKARIAAIAVVVPLILAACSSNDGGASNGSAAPSQSVAAPGTFDAAQCAQAVGAWAAAAAAVPTAMTGGGGDLQTSIDQLKAFAENAPDEIKGDLTTVVEGYSAFMQAMADAGYDPSSGQPPSADAIAAIQAASASLSTPEFNAASSNVSSWFSQNCGG